jgi:hypothetical protein
MSARCLQCDRVGAASSRLLLTLSLLRPKSSCRKRAFQGAVWFSEQENLARVTMPVSSMRRLSRSNASQSLKYHCATNPTECTSIHNKVVNVGLLIFPELAAISGDLLSAVISIRCILGFRKDNPNVFNMLVQNLPITRCLFRKSCASRF